jgi:putative inorganic carbon (hco3(-)) transporter
MRSGSTLALDCVPLPVPRRRISSREHSGLRFLLAPLEAAIKGPAALYLFTLSVFLFRPPTLEFYFVDRIAFCILVMVVGLRVLVLHQTLPRTGLSWPMAGLALLAIVGMAHHASEAATWSVLAAKFFVPFAMFWMAGVVFHSEQSLKWLERFLLGVLAYLSFISIAHLVGAYDLIFPRFILDESIGIHADRARGPFLQAVANGVTINLLALLAIDCYCRKRLRGVMAFLLLAALPVAILATKTRGVWLSFALSVMWMISRLGDRRLWRAFPFFGIAGVLGVALAIECGNGRELGGRLRENSPVEFRMAAYRAGWEMFLERPILGWGTQELQAELARRIDGFRGKSFAVHNTYFDVLLEQGAPGLGLYAWLAVALFRLGRTADQGSPPVVASIRSLWPVLLVVYFVNATFVVMSYQFVNGLLFTCAGVLAAHSASAKSPRALSRLR